MRAACLSMPRIVEAGKALLQQPAVIPVAGQHMSDVTWQSGVPEVCRHNADAGKWILHHFMGSLVIAWVASYVEANRT